MKKVLLGVVSVLIIALIAVGGWYVFNKPNGNGQGPDPRESTLPLEEELRLTRSALAAAENLNPEKADPLWQELLAANPNDADAWQNLAITRLTALDSVVKKIESGQITPEEEEQAYAALPQLFANLQAAMDGLKKAAEASGEQRTDVVLWLETQFAILSAKLSEDDQQRSMTELAKTLSARLKANPAAMFLVGPLVDDVAALARDPFGGADTELVKSIADALLAAADASPKNLAVNFPAMRYAILSEDPRAADIARRLADLSAPFSQLIRERMRGQGVDTDAFDDQVIEFVTAGNFAEAERVAMQWFNSLNGTKVLESDRKPTQPHPLDLIATSTYNRLSLEAAGQSLQPSNVPWKFVPKPLENALSGDAVAIASVDFDLMLPSELAVATKDHLVLLQQDDQGSWSRIAEQALPNGTRGILVADLFEVDLSHPERIKSPTAEREESALPEGQVLPLKRSAEPSDAQAVDLGLLKRQHDTFPCLVCWGEYGVRIFRLNGRQDVPMDQRLLPVDRETGLEEMRNVIAAITGDIDADGDLDLVLSGEESGVDLWINRGDITFFSVSNTSQLPDKNDPVVAMAIGDLDRDLDLDIATIQRSGQVGKLENLLHLQMRWLPIDGTTTNAPGQGVAVVEWDGNVSWDVAYWNDEQVNVWTSETLSAGNAQTLKHQSLQLPTNDAQRSSTGFVQSQLITADLDNDTWPDLLIVGHDTVRLVRGGPSELAIDSLATIDVTGVSGVTLSDFDLNRSIDLAAIQDGKVVLLMNETEVANVIAVQMKGIYDNAAGTGRVNHYAIGTTLELRIGPHYRAAIIADRTTYFGLGKAETADTLRAILTNGVTQNVSDVKANTILFEEQSLKGSCPYLYTWDGEKFVFVTDCLWAAPLGLQYAAGKVVPDRPWEYLKVDGKFLAEKDGYYEIRLTEELWEIAYFDKVSLIAVDHPEEVEIWTNEKVGPPDTVQPKIFTFTETKPVVSAVDSQGRDCAELLAEADERYVQGFDQRIIQGLCPTHWVDLDLGKIDASDRVLLKLTGWIFPTDTSLNIQIDQNPLLEAMTPPSVWIPGEEGGWVESIPSMGFPGGKTKTIVVELTGKLNLQDPRVRIQTNAQIYWDAAEVVVNPPEVEIVSTPLEMVSAEVAWHGFSNQLPRDSTQPHRYSYDAVSDVGPWPPLAGKLTRFGDCLALLGEWDDAMVVIAGGDEVRIRFRAPDGPPAGWKRDFILHSVGWDKDADLNTLAGQSVDPLPFREMRSYPPLVQGQQRAEEVERLNRWHLNRGQSFRKFWTR